MPANRLEDREGLKEVMRVRRTLDRMDLVIGISTFLSIILKIVDMKQRTVSCKSGVFLSTIESQ